MDVPFTGSNWPDEGGSMSDVKSVIKNRFYIEDIYPIEIDKVTKKQYCKIIDLFDNYTNLNLIK